MPQAEAINEADIFIAYGRFDHARELLEAGLEREPDRDDLRLKLLMVHLKQGNRQDATRQAERLEASGDPTVQAEATRLMGNVGDSSALAAGSSERRAEEDSRTATAKAQATPAEVPEDVGDSVATPDKADSEPPASTAPELTSRQDEQGRDIIDYQPPSLDPAPAVRLETPMQPSIEFTSSARVSADLAEPAASSTSTTETFSGNDLSQEWEVEEVVFPPLDQDNGVPATGASSSALDEARDLLHAGDAKRARSLLKNLADGDDATTREEAQSLLTRHDL